MRQRVICFGEVLWDVFPDGEKIGGAPLNVALRLNELGISSAIVSKIGEDDLGNRLLAFITRPEFEHRIYANRPLARNRSSTGTTG